MKELIVQIKPKWHAENATLNISKEDKTVHLEMFDDTGEYSEMWIDFEDVVNISKHLNDFIQSVSK